MASFDAEELADFIRHHCIVNAGDNGQCKKIVQPPSRKAKPGGLPLNFRSASESDTSSEEYSPCYLATGNWESTYELIQERLRSKIQEDGLTGSDDEDKTVEKNATDASSSIPDLEFFQFKNISCTPSPVPMEKSATALLLEKTDFVVRSDLAAYARFASPDIRIGRKLLVFYPFAKPEPGNDKCFSLTIYAHNEISISDLTGLCCYEYARCRRTNDIGFVAQYHLLMAEESGEVERDLPSIDGHRLLNELGSCWSTVALEKRHTSSCSTLGTKNAIIYTISGKRYEFALDSLDLPLRWLRDQAVKKRIEDEGHDFISACPACSRGDFTPTRYGSFREERSITLKTYHSISSPPERRHSLDLAPAKHTRAGMTVTSSSFDANNSLGLLIASYPVEKVYRYKPKRNASLIIRRDGFELALNQLDLTPKRFHSSAKTLCVRWDYVGEIEIIDTSRAKRGVRIVWLAYQSRKNYSKAGELVSSTGELTWSMQSEWSAESTRLSRRKAYNKSYWKILQLLADVNDAWNIMETASTIINDRNSEIRQIYRYSNSGTKKPREAVAEAFGSDAGTQSKGKLNSIRSVMHGASQLTSTVTSIVPSLQRLLSKHK
uniref:Sin1 middle CRIM domain-containing protein n=1 Tax=Setaria digitata TaxID=48799 RepID=A0A915PP44_9BILA